MEDREYEKLKKNNLEIIVKDVEGKDKAKIAEFIGTLDVTTVRQADNTVESLIEEGNSIILDFTKLDHLSSTGLFCGSLWRMSLTPALLSLQS